jgi:hypothetical protein
VSWASSASRSTWRPRACSSRSLRGVTEDRSCGAGPPARPGRRTGGIGQV